MKTLLLVTVLLLAGVVVKAQSTFFPTKEGTVLVYKTYDKKKNLLGITRYTIEKVDKTGEQLEITYRAETMDAMEKLLFSDEYSVQQKGDTVYFDMSNMLDLASLQVEGELPDSLTVEGSALEVPLEPKIGDKLPDATVELALGGDSALRMGSELTNRKVVTVEDVTVLAGTYTAYKLSSEVNTTAGGVSTKSRNVDWYVKGIGPIKSENYENGKLKTRTILAEMVGGQ
jgi:hypothetical protein